MSILIGVVAAVVLALLAYPLWSFGVVAVGAALGFMILGELGVVLNFPELGVILLGILGALIFGFLFYRARDLFVIIATAYNGAVQVVYGLGLFHAARAIGSWSTYLFSSCGHSGARFLRLHHPIQHVQRPAEICHVKPVTPSGCSRRHLPLFCSRLYQRCPILER